MSAGLLAFTLFHTALSLVQLVAGIIVVFQLLGSRSGSVWTPIYIVSAVATSVTGFMFPVNAFLPSHAVGILSLILLAVIILARYRFHLAGSWRWIYTVALVTTVYLDAFVAVVQAFQKIPTLRALAPNGSEPPFAIAQGIVLVIFVVLGIMATRTFHPAPRIA